MTSLPDGFRVVRPEDVEHLVRLVRGLLVDGADHEQALGRLRRDCVPKAVCVRVMQEAAGLSHGDAKLLVHNSLAWGDRRAADEQLEAQFFRALFIMCVLGEGTVNEPDEDVAEWRDRRQRARRLLDEIAEPLPSSARGHLDQCLAANRLGQAFTELVRLTEHIDLGQREWELLVQTADALCLDELVGDDEPPGDDPLLHAAWLVPRTRHGRPSEHHASDERR